MSNIYEYYIVLFIREQEECVCGKEYVSEELLIKFGEFYPYAGATTYKGEFVSVGGDPVDEFDPGEAITSLKHLCNRGIKNIWWQPSFMK